MTTPVASQRQRFNGPLDSQRKAALRQFNRFYHLIGRERGNGEAAPYVLHTLVVPAIDKGGGAADQSGQART